jgi:enamine deaminase RidA (YjgF/YER057c/UK114 family)
MEKTPMLSSAEPLLPVQLGHGAVSYAQAMRAGRWVFATGHLAQDYANGIADAVMLPGMPFHGQPPGEREAHFIFDHLETVLAAADTHLQQVVRVDQYYTSPSAVSPYQRARRQRFGNHAPASTSMVMKELLLPGASMEVEVIAIVPSEDFQVRQPAPVPLSAGTIVSPVAIAGDFVFISGQLATADPGIQLRDGLPLEACIPPGAFWGGQPIRAETDYVMKKRVRPALEAAGSSLSRVLKAQIYLTQPSDLPVFNEVWHEWFGDDLPATTIVVSPEHSIGIAAARIEINIIALRDDAATTHKQVIRCDDVAPAYAHHPAAVRAGDLLFLSGLMANDAEGAVKNARQDPRQPYFGSSAEAQAACIIAKAERICAAAGASLSNVVRIQQFHTDLAEFYPVHASWRRHLGGYPLPFSAIGVPGPLPIPGCSVLMDLWVYAP